MQAAFSARYDAALAFAARAHRSQLRKGSDTPYITHPVHVSIILLRHGFGEDLAIAGLLHDAVEDCDIPIAEVQAAFGPVVAQLVDAVSEQKRDAGVERPWEQRKAEKLADLQRGGPDVAALKAADTLHNARTTAIDLRRDGPATWGRFKRGADQTIGYYRAVLAAVASTLGPHPMVTELRDAIDDLASLSVGA